MITLRQGPMALVFALSMARTLRRVFLKYILPITLGGALYASCRTPVLLYERLALVLFGVRWLGVKATLNSACLSLIGEGQVYALIVYSLPNALWHLSLCYFLEQGLRSFFGRASFVWRFRLVWFVLLAQMPDLLQWAGYLSGVADPADVLLAVVASVIVCATTKTA